jgi:hypothetical protein
MSNSPQSLFDKSPAIVEHFQSNNVHLSDDPYMKKLKKYKDNLEQQQ